MQKRCKQAADPDCLLHKKSVFSSASSDRESTDATVVLTVNAAHIFCTTMDPKRFPNIEIRPPKAKTGQHQTDQSLSALCLLIGVHQ